MPEVLSNQKYIGAKGKISLYDIHIVDNSKGVIVFLHGYMGYKDWGCWNLVMDFFTRNRYSFIKYNVSHNGTSLTNPKEFTDFESFGNNSYSNECADLKEILSIVSKKNKSNLPIHLIGHSRGGGIALLQAENNSLSSISSWAGICSIEKRFPTGEKLIEWKTSDVRFQYNGRTKQNLPLYYSQYEDFIQNKNKLSIEKACRSAKASIQIIHGDSDTSVKLDEGKKLAEWTNTKLLTIKNTAHTFDSKEPWDDSKLPDALLEVCQLTLKFIAHG